MNDDQLDDLKQFIANTVSQTETRLQTQISEVGGRVDEVQTQLGQLRQEMADGFEGVAEAIEQIHQQAETLEAEVDRRFTKLEQQTA
jgi:predicted  nucleic acid-binding Zn-ribbon protein